MLNESEGAIELREATVVEVESQKPEWCICYGKKMDNIIIFGNICDLSINGNKDCFGDENI